MITPRADGPARIVRVPTYGKEPAAVDHAIVDAVEGGCRVLVKVASASETPSDAVAVSDWAEAISRRHGLVWERVGGDVLFRRPLSRAEAPPGQ